MFVDTPIEECIRRDPKGLYAKAKAGGIEHFTGLDSPYEAPQAPEMRVTTIGTSAEQAAAADHRRAAPAADHLTDAAAARRAAAGGALRPGPRSASSFSK